MGGIFDAIFDENTITFKDKESYDKAQKIKEYIDEKNISSDQREISGADEIQKLYSLMQKGIISKKEFEQKKKY